MGSGRWTADEFERYARSVRGMDAKKLEKTSFRAQEFYRSRALHPTLNPANVVRECCDNEEHPNTVPVILALDVTGSMGSAAVRAATHLNRIITGIYSSDTIRDVEFCVMAIGDLHYDRAPIQISQFESDIRIAEQMDNIWFEGGGGGNSYESYSAAWYMGLHHCDLDCWKRGKKGLIITLGDELPNPTLRAYELKLVTQDNVQADVETPELLKEAREKFEIYHLSVKDPASSYVMNQRRLNLDKAWKGLLGEKYYRVVTIEDLAETITELVRTHAKMNGAPDGTGETAAWGSGREDEGEEEGMLAKLRHFW